MLEQQEENKVQMENVLEDQRKNFQEFLQDQVEIFGSLIKLNECSAMGSQFLSWQHLLKHENCLNT